MKMSSIISNWVSDFIEMHGSDEMYELWCSTGKEKFLKLVEKNTKKVKATKIKKDKDAPKGARTGYILYCMEERPKIKEEFPEMKNQDIVKEMAKRWKKLQDDEEALEYYRKLAEQDKERAVKEKGEYVPDEEPEEPKKKTTRTKTGYQLFCDDERANVKEDGFVGREVMVELGRRWKALPEEDEDRWEKYMSRAKMLKNKVVEEDVVEETEEEEEKPKKVKKTKRILPIKKDEEEKEKPKKKRKIIVDEDDEDDE